MFLPQFLPLSLFPWTIAAVLTLPVFALFAGRFWRPAQRPPADTASDSDFSLSGQEARYRRSVLVRDVEARWR